MRQVLLIGADRELNGSIAALLAKKECEHQFAAGHADALRRLRSQCFDVVITDPAISVEEDLAFAEEIRLIRPGVKMIILSPHSAPDEVIAALRARVFACFSPPFDPATIAEMASQASEDEWRSDIEVISAEPEWISLHVNCRVLTAERLLTFFNELRSDLPEAARQALMMAFREILTNAMEHGAGYNAEKVVAVTAMKTGRSLVFYVRDPGAGFRGKPLPHAAVSNTPEDPVAHLDYREEHGMRPGGYGILVTRGIVDELIYNEFGNEVLLIKYLA
jgi:DNA-binding NarL/FixJ family response regulator/anti-sigma regulatory factor (Ser/Thr protein kinase)